MILTCWLLVTPPVIREDGEPFDPWTEGEAYRVIVGPQEYERAVFRWLYFTDSSIIKFPAMLGDELKVSMLDKHRREGLYGDSMTVKRGWQVTPTRMYCR